MRRTQGVIVIGHDIRESVRNVPACYNLLGFVGFIRELAGTDERAERGRSFVAHQKEAKDNTSDEQPASNFKRNCHAGLGLWTVVEDLVRPLLGGQHGDRREYIRDVDKKVLKHDDVEPHVPRRG